MQQDECIDKPATEQILRSTCQPHDFPSLEIYKKIFLTSQKVMNEHLPPPLTGRIFNTCRPNCNNGTRYVTQDQNLTLPINIEHCRGFLYYYYMAGGHLDRSDKVRVSSSPL